MDYTTFLTHVIEDGVRAAKQDYAKPEQANKLQGSIEGFEQCRSKTPSQLKELLELLRKATSNARNDNTELTEYWKIRCREVEVEWVCNVVSAMLMNQRLPIIIPPTARGVMRAAEVLQRTN